MSVKIEFSPIGVFKNPERKYTYDVGRQATSTLESSQNEGVIELTSGSNFEQALIGLQPEDFIWIIYQFHQNTTWKPMVLPPRGTESKQGVFATRSPYRPNPIGISACQILKIEGLKIYVTVSDLIDGTPILDIKPYLASSDSFPGKKPSWLVEESFQLIESELFKAQIQFLEAAGLRALRPFIYQQLSEKPLVHPHKRIAKDVDLDPLIKGKELYQLSYRTWRIHFAKQDDQLFLNQVSSGYLPSDLALPDDPYGDKSLHREFVKYSWSV